MSARKSSGRLKTWIELDRSALQKNVRTFRGLIGRNVKLWGVVKSNAYGHGIFDFAPALVRAGVQGLCVDSVIEGKKLRGKGVKVPILVLGPTLPGALAEARTANLTVSPSTLSDLKALAAEEKPPLFHLKVDTGMNRRGFLAEDKEKVIRLLRARNLKDRCTGIFTHFASAKDINYPTYTERQFAEYMKWAKALERAGFKNLTKHVAATGGTLINKKYHLDAVRVGIGLCGLWSSKELEVQMPQVHLTPVLSWRAFISEVKTIKPGSFVGYDLTARVSRPTKIAVIPIGYWHGFPRSLSGIGEVLINGKRAKVLGRVSMDVIAVDATGIGVSEWDTATLLGKNGGEELFARDVAEKSGTTHYEFLTRINPLIERTLI